MCFIANRPLTFPLPNELSSYSTEEHTGEARVVEDEEERWCVFVIRCWINIWKKYNSNHSIVLVQIKCRHINWIEILPHGTNMGPMHKFKSHLSFFLECVILVFYRVLKNWGADSENSGFVFFYSQLFTDCCSKALTHTIYLHLNLFPLELLLVLLPHVSDEQIVANALKYSTMEARG